MSCHVNTTFEILGQSYVDNPQLVAEVCGWISEITGSTQGDLTPQEWLRDGKVLCALMNKVKPAAKIRPNKLNKPFMMRENITMFLRAVRQFYPRLKESDFFSTDDLYDGKDMTQVINFIYSFGGVVQLDPDSAGFPCLGVAQQANTKIDARRGNKMITDLNSGFQESTAVDVPMEYVGGRPACVVGDANAYDDSLDARKKELAKANSIKTAEEGKKINQGRAKEENAKAERNFKPCEFDSKPVAAVASEKATSYYGASAAPAQADDSEDSAAEVVADEKPSDLDYSFTRNARSFFTNNVNNRNNTSAPKPMGRLGTGYYTAKNPVSAYPPSP